MALSGTLVVVVLKARNLPDKHTFYKQDVLSEITLGSEILRTKIDVKGGQHPMWDEELRIPVSSEAKDYTLRVACYGKEARQEELLGTGKVDIGPILKSGEFDDWVTLYQGKAYRGEIYLEMTFYASAPSTGIGRRPSKLHPATRLARPDQIYHYPHLPKEPVEPERSPVQAPSPPKKVTPIPEVEEPFARHRYPLHDTLTAAQSLPKDNELPGHLTPPRSKPNTPSPKGNNETLPPVPAKDQSPAAESSKRLSAPPSTSGGLGVPSPNQLSTMPSILRPRNPKYRDSAVPIHADILGGGSPPMRQQPIPPEDPIPPIAGSPPRQAVIQPLQPGGGTYKPRPAYDTFSDSSAAPRPAGTQPLQPGLGTYKPRPAYDTFSDPSAAHTSSSPSIPAVTQPLQPGGGTYKPRPAYDTFSDSSAAPTGSSPPRAAGSQPLQPGGGTFKPRPAYDTLNDASTAPVSSSPPRQPATQPYRQRPAYETFDNAPAQASVAGGMQPLKPQAGSYKPRPAYDTYGDSTPSLVTTAISPAKQIQASLYDTYTPSPRQSPTLPTRVPSFPTASLPHTNAQPASYDIYGYGGSQQQHSPTIGHLPSASLDLYSYSAASNFQQQQQRPPPPVPQRPLSYVSNTNDNTYIEVPRRRPKSQEDGVADPRLISRYTTPLPLPSRPGHAARPSQTHEDLVRQQARDAHISRSTTPQPPTSSGQAPKSTATMSHEELVRQQAREFAEHDNQVRAAHLDRRARAREQEERDLKLAREMDEREKEQEEKDLKLAKELHEREMEQEERDLELARALDRELNAES